MAVSEVEQPTKIQPLGKKPTTMFSQGSPLHHAFRAMGRAAEKNGSSRTEGNPHHEALAPRAVTIDGLPGFRRQGPQKRIVIDGDEMIM
jgi:hypothetical protein